MVQDNFGVVAGSKCTRFEYCRTVRKVQLAIGKISGMFRSAPHSPPLCPCACPNTIRVYSCLVLSLHALLVISPAAKCHRSKYRHRRGEFHIFLLLASRLLPAPGRLTVG